MCAKWHNIQAAIVSRVIAMVLTAFPLAAMGLEFDRQDQLVLKDLRTYEELRVYVESSLIGNFWAAFGIVLVVGFGYIALVEELAYSHGQVKVTGFTEH